MKHLTFWRVILLSSLIINCFFHWYTVAGYQAVTIVPVADLIGQNHTHAMPSYAHMPICANKGPYTCPRVGQLLYNEQVSIIKEVGDEVCIKIPHLFYITPGSKEKNTLYWSLKKNFARIDKLTHTDPAQAIPEPIWFAHPEKNYTHNVAVLTWPYQDPKTGILFSAGTRFVLAQEQDNDQMVSVMMINPHHHKQQSLQLPKNITILEQQRTPAEQKKLFLKLLRSWANMNDGFIPYVWGGASIGKPCTDNNFTKIQDHQHNKAWYYRPDAIPNPYWGIDCSGLVARAAQIAGMPYYFKNTTTLGEFMKPVSRNHPLEDGDLIWYPGHVMVVGSVANNTLIEAVGYNTGYGKLHEIPLSQVFKNITTYDQLVAALYAQKPITRLFAREEPAERTFNRFKLLSMNSIWS